LIDFHSNTQAGRQLMPASVAFDRRRERQPVAAKWDGAFTRASKRKFPVNAAMAATILNAEMVNAGSWLLKLPAFWQKTLFDPHFVTSKTTVNYSSRFELTMLSDILTLFSVYNQCVWRVNVIYCS
jgi:hypothetical protein